MGIDAAAGSAGPEKIQAIEMNGKHSGAEGQYGPSGDGVLATDLGCTVQAQKLGSADGESRMQTDPNLTHAVAVTAMAVSWSVESDCSDITAKPTSSTAADHLGGTAAANEQWKEYAGDKAAAQEQNQELSEDQHVKKEDYVDRDAAEKLQDDSLGKGKSPGGLDTGRL